MAAECVVLKWGMPVPGCCKQEPHVRGGTARPFTAGPLSAYAATRRCPVLTVVSAYAATRRSRY
eukprot:2477421-Rhodomonas_salina.1